MNGDPRLRVLESSRLKFVARDLFHPLGWYEDLRDLEGADSLVVASWARGPFGCIVSDMLVASDNAISLVLKDIGADNCGSRVRYRERAERCVKGVGL